MSNHLIFVYGSLKRGFHNHSWLDNVAYCGDGMTKDSNLIMSDAGAYPIVYSRDLHNVDGADDWAGYYGHVSGELYIVDSATLANLDRLEGHPTFYRRRKVDILRSGQRTVPAWMYMSDKPDAGPYIEAVTTAGFDVLTWEDPIKKIRARV